MFAIDGILSEIDKLKEKYRDIPDLQVELSSLKEAIQDARSKPVKKFCHRSIGGAYERMCKGKECDRYNNCRVVWKRGELDLVTYGIGEEL